MQAKPLSEPDQLADRFDVVVDPTAPHADIVRPLARLLLQIARRDRSSITSQPPTDRGDSPQRDVKNG
jgi:hypothetical protein